MTDKKRPLLSWGIEDYKNQGIEVPETLSSSPDKTEGELMSEDDIRSWIADTVRTFSVIKQEDPNLFEELYLAYTADIGYLKKLEKITEVQAEALTKKGNFNF